MDLSAESQFSEIVPFLDFSLIAHSRHLINILGLESIYEFDLVD